MTFDVAAEAYASFMGRYAGPLAHQLVRLADVTAEQHVLDVGCGPGTVIEVLVEQVGAHRVCAVDPSADMVRAARDRFSDVAVTQASAEALPFTDGRFDVAVAQLVVPFMDDPVRGLREMRRVVRPGGRVVACAWDVDSGPMAGFWRAAEEVDPGAGDAVELPGGREGQLAALMTQVGLDVVEDTRLSVHVEVETFEEWWAAFGHGIGPAGEYVVSSDPAQREALRARCRAAYPRDPLTISGTAWATVGERPAASGSAR